MSEHWQLFRIDELDSISFTCPTCQTISTFNGSGDQAGRTERQCPGCNRAIPRAGEILHLYRTLYATARSAAENEKVSIALRSKAEG